MTRSRSGCSWAMALAVLLPAFPMAARADQSLAVPADLKAQASSFVDFYAATGEHVLDRWRDPICVKVSGLPADQASAVEARIEQVAKAVGARTQRDGCKPANVQIGFTDDKGMSALGDWTVDRDAKAVTLPIQARYVTNRGTVADNSAGDLKVRVVYQAGPAGAPAGYPPGAAFNPSPGGGGGLASSEGSSGFGRGAGPWAPPRPRVVHRAFTNAQVFVDTRRTGGKSRGLISDYVALLALSQPGDLGRCNVLPSVTDLFADCPGRAAPDGLTPADTAFLTALYAAKTGKTGDEKDDIAGRMAKILVKGQFASR